MKLALTRRRELPLRGKLSRLTGLPPAVLCKGL